MSSLHCGTTNPFSPAADAGRDGDAVYMPHIIIININIIIGG